MSLVDLPALGVDVEAVARFASIDSRLFTEAELDHAAGRPESLAGIWCAKESVVKAIGRWESLSVRDVEISYVGERPEVHIPGFDIEVSISHTVDYAVAVAMGRPNATGGAA